MALGSLGAFLVLEAREHAAARNAKPLARLASVQSDRSNRQPGDVSTRARADVEEASRRGSQRGRAAVISGATGAEPATAEERAWLADAARRPRARDRHAISGMASSRNSP